MRGRFYKLEIFLPLNFSLLFLAASLSENVIRGNEIIRPIPQRFAVGSAGADPSVLLSAVQTRPQRTLINPFKPNEIPCNWTCNRHRWAHVFPLGPDGEILHRHYHKLSTAENEIHVKLEKVHVHRQYYFTVVTTVITNHSNPIPLSLVY